jgi:CIC family chloride channel protein
MNETASSEPRPADGRIAPAAPITLQRGPARLSVGLRESKGGLVVLALAVGAGAGLGAVAFRWMIKTFTLLLSGHTDYSAAGHAANPYLPWLGRFFVLLAPVLAGLIYGPLVQRYAREARGHGVPEVMYAVARRCRARRPGI